MFEKNSWENADLTTDLAEMTDFFKSFEAFLSDPATSQDDPMDAQSPADSGKDGEPKKPKTSKSTVESVPKPNLIYKAHLNPSGSSRELKVTLKTVPEDTAKKLVPSKPIVPPIIPRTPPPIVHKPIKPINGKVHPPTYPPPNRPGRNTNQLNYIRKTVLPLVWDHKFGWPFHKPVDAIKLDIPDYHKIIQQPMDLGTIKKRLSNKYYWTSKECMRDFELMFKNCMLYNKEGQDIVMMAKTLENIYETKLKSMPPIEVDLNAPKPQKVVKKTLPMPTQGKDKRSIFESQEYQASKKVKTKVKVKEMKNIDFETEIPLAQIGWPSGITVGPDEKKLVTSTKQNQVESDDDSDEYDSEESDDSSESESDSDKVGTPAGVSIKHKLPPPPVRQEPLPKKPRTLLTERKPIKHLCKYCAQPFISKFVRDMHEKKHLKQGTAGVQKQGTLPGVQKPGTPGIQKQGSTVQQNVFKPSIQKKVSKEVKPTGRPADIKLNPDKDIKNNATASSAKQTKQNAKSSSLQIIPVKQQQAEEAATNEAPKPSNMTPFVAKPYNEKDETFVDKKKQAMTKQAEAQKNLIAQKQNNPGIGSSQSPVKNNYVPSSSLAQENKSGPQRIPISPSSNPVITQDNSAIQKRVPGVVPPNSVVKTLPNNNITHTVENNSKLSPFKQSACDKDSIKESESTFFDEMKDMTIGMTKTLSPVGGIPEQQSDKILASSIVSPSTGSYHDDSSGHTPSNRTPLSNHFDELVSPRPEKLTSNYDEQKELENFLSDNTKPSNEKSQNSFSARSDVSSRKDSSERHFDDMLSPEAPGLSTSSAIQREIENLLSDKSAKPSHERYPNIRRDVNSPEMQKNNTNKTTNQVSRAGAGLNDQFNIHNLKGYQNKMEDEREIGDRLQKHLGIKPTELKLSDLGIGSSGEINFPNHTTVSGFRTQTTITNGVLNVDKKMPTQPTYTNSSLTMTPVLKSDLKSSSVSKASEMVITSPTKFKTTTQPSHLKEAIISHSTAGKYGGSNQSIRNIFEVRNDTSRFENLPFTTTTRMTVNQGGTTQSMPRMSTIQGVTSQSMPRMSAIQGITSQSMPRISTIQGSASQSMSRVSNILGTTTPSMSRVSTNQGNNIQSMPRITVNHGIVTQSMPRVSSNQGNNSQSMPRISAIQGITSQPMPRISTNQGITTQSMSRMSNHGITIQSMSRNTTHLGNSIPVTRSNTQMLPTEPRMSTRVEIAVPSSKMTITPIRQNSNSLGIGPVPTALDPRPPSHQINRRQEEALPSPRKEHHVFPELNFNSDIKSGKGDVLEQTLKLSEITPDLSDEFDRLQNQGKKMPPLSYTNDRGQTRTAQPPRMPALLSSSRISKPTHAPPLIQNQTQELKLEDLRHVACIKPHVDISSPESIPPKEDLIQLSLNQTLDLTVTNKQNSSSTTIHSLTSHEDLMDFSNITYQDVRQLIGQSETPSFTIYPEPTDVAYSEVISSGQQQPVFLSPSPASPSQSLTPTVSNAQSVPSSSSYSLTLTPTTLSVASNYFPVQSIQSPTFSLAPTSNFSLTSLPFSTVSALPSFGSDLVYTYSDVPSVSLDPNTVYTVPLGLQQFIQGGEVFQQQQEESFQDARRAKDSSTGRSSTLGKWWT